MNLHHPCHPSEPVPQVPRATAGHRATESVSGGNGCEMTGETVNMNVGSDGEVIFLDVSLEATFPYALW